MEKIPLPAYDAVPLDHIADGLTGLRLLMVNVFGISHPDQSGWTLIDAGIYFSADRIRHWASSHFGERPPSAIILTHGHFDHVGSIQELLKTWDVPVYAHPIEMPYLTGQSEYPPPDPTVGGGIMALLSPLYPRGPIDLGSRVQILPSDNTLPNLPGWRWIHTPGHTDGHVSFFRDEDRTLIVGDAFCTTKQESFLAVAEQRPEMHGPPAYYTPDWDAARASVQKLAALRPHILAPSHGLPMAGPEVESALATLAAHFDEIARPVHK